MGEGNTSGEGTSSENVRVIKFDELEGLKNLPADTIVRVSDRMFRPYIRLEDAHGEPIWRPFNWEPIEEIKKIHKWENEGQKLFEDKARDSEELNALRELVIAVALVIHFYEMGEETHQQLLEIAISKFAIEWYKKDHDGKEPAQTESDLAPYHNLVTRYIKLYVDTVNGARQSTEQLAEQVNAEEKTE